MPLACPKEGVGGADAAGGGMDRDVGPLERRGEQVGCWPAPRSNSRAGRIVDADARRCENARLLAIVAGADAATLVLVQSRERTEAMTGRFAGATEIRGGLNASSRTTQRRKASVIEDVSCGRVFRVGVRWVSSIGGLR